MHQYLLQEFICRVPARVTGGVFGRFIFIFLKFPVSVFPFFSPFFPFCLIPLVPPNYDRVSLRLCIKRLHWKFGLRQKLQNAQWRLDLIASLFPFNCFERSGKTFSQFSFYFLKQQVLTPHPPPKKKSINQAELAFCMYQSLPCLGFSSGQVCLLWG